MKLIPDWKKCWKMWSMRISAFGALVMGAIATWPEQLMLMWQSMPAEVRDLIPTYSASYVAAGLFAACAIARLVKQSNME